MLLSFRFTNHRSFRSEQQLNLTPAYGSEQGWPSDAAVPVAGIFGANASGKSNALDALWFMRQLAIRSDREVEPGLGLVRHPFRLDATTTREPSRYVVDLDIDGVRHTYGFTISDEQVVEEWLYYYPLKKRRNVFERDGDTFRWGEESAKRDELDRIAGITARTALFLSTTARFEQRTPRGPSADPLHQVYRWFFRVTAHFRAGPRRFAPRWPDAEEDRSVVTALLRAADVGITDVRLKNPVRDPLHPRTAEDNSEWGEQLHEVLSGDPRDRNRLQFAHRGPRGEVLLELVDESTGTRQLLDLAVDAATVLRLNGTMLVDEIDASLHPMLTAKLIGLFQSATTNPTGSQLIFTSHDAALLGTFDAEEVLHRDEIWFTEKADDGSSALYPLSDFKPRREGENRQRRYLNGNYGGVPELSADVFEQALAARGEPRATS
jgi:hypothetical protein